MLQTAPSSGGLGWLAPCSRSLIFFGLQDAVPNGGARSAPVDEEEEEEEVGDAVQPLEEFIPLGSGPTTAAKPTSGAGASGRPEPLAKVPWLRALKGIHSPLLRLHQGEPPPFRTYPAIAGRQLRVTSRHSGSAVQPRCQPAGTRLQRLWSSAATWRPAPTSRRSARRP